MEGKIEGNTTGRAGYSKVDVLLEEDTPLQLSLGNIISSDYHGEATPYFDRTYFDPITGELDGIKFERMKKVYVSIKVQDTPHSYKELILVDLFQETVIEGKNKTRIGNSGPQTSAESQNGMTWVEAYIAESFIPLTKTAMLKVKLFDRRRLLAETKCHFIQAVNITKTKWYQTSIFKIILIIIAVVITVYTAGAGASVGAILLDLAVNAAIAFGINYVIDLLVEKGIISAEVGLVLKIVVSIYISGNGSFNVDLSLLDSAALIVEATGTYYQQQLLLENKEYKDKMRKLKEESKKYEDTPSEYSSGLSVGLSMELQQLRDDASYRYESVEAFFARVLNTDPIAASAEIDVTQVLTKGLEI
jgi:hypothetical protein